MVPLTTAMPLTSYIFIGIVIVGFPLLGWVLYRYMMNKPWVTEVKQE